MVIQTNIYFKPELRQIYCGKNIISIMELYPTRWILVLTIQLFAGALSSLPNCHTSDFFQVLPLVPNQSFIIDIPSLVQGYNLQFNVTAEPDIEPYVKVGNKIKLNQQQYPDMPLSGLKGFYLGKKGNSWGQQFVALTERGDRTLIHSGILNANDSVPVINYYATVENLTNTTCFDAVQVAASNVIIVDCIQRRTSRDSRGRLYQNIFYYFRISDGAKLKQLTTQMYVPFQQVSRRKLLLYSDLLSSHTFLLRAYFADSMTDASRDNTYLQVLMIEDPLSPWVVGVIDRTFLGVPKLRMVDVKVYLGQIYLLDQAKGVHRIYISGAEDLIYRGCYEARGFNRLAVFSPNLDNRIEVAISNSHAVHEVDWTEINEPRLINKYSLLPDSSVKQLFLNQRFLFVRSSASDTQTTYEYTWTFTRGDRTYSRAFAVMKHASQSFLVDLNEEMSYLMVVNQDSISNFAYNDPSFILKLESKQQLLNKLSSFTFYATSSDPNTPTANVTCSITINFTLLDPNNRTMWIVGRGPPSHFSANYPGKLRIELGDYVLGPNVTYRVRETKKGQLKKAKVYQQEQLIVQWEQAPPFGNISFLQTETFSGATSDVLMIYTQDDRNVTFISECLPDHELLKVSCKLVKQWDIGGSITNWGTSMVRQPLTQEDHHILGYTTGSFYNTVFLEDLTTGQEITQLNLGRGFPGNISSLSLSANYMFTVLKHIKRVNIYSLDDCLDDNCVSICSLNHLNMYRLGVKYFAPRTVHSSRFHPDLLFVKTDDSILAIDLSKQCVPKVLSIIKPVESARIPFGFQVNANFLVVTIQPDIVQEYDISRIYLGEVRITKKYPLYGYKLPANYDFDISNYGNCIYLSTLTQGGDYNVFVYRSGLPAVGSLYNQIDLLAFEHVLIDASGKGVDYLTVISGKDLRIFRQYERPEAEIDNPSEDYEFYLQYFNSLDTAQLQLLDVEIINLPTYIIVNPILKDIMNTKDLLYSGQNRLNTIDDSDWYQGNVLYIQPSCNDCPDKVKVNNHIQLETTRHLTPKLTSYVYSTAGGTLLAQDALFQLKNNGSFAQIATLHSDNRKRCLEVAVGYHFIVTGCKEEQLVWLQAISSVGSKQFVFEAQETSALGLVHLKVSNQLVMLVDAEDDCYVKTRKGGIFLFEINDDLESDEALSEVEYIDGDDFGMRELGDIYINNAELFYLQEQKVYRLYVSEVNRGLLIMEFQHLPGRADIVVRRTYFIEIRGLLVALGETLPYDATFQAITLMGSTKNSAARTVTDRLLVTTGRYHTLQIAITFDSNSNLVSKVIERLYLRYSYYEVTNDIKFVDGLFLIRQSLPAEYNPQNRTQQLYTIYSTSGIFNGSVQKRGLIGALPLAEAKLHRFDFNRTLTPDAPNEGRTGLVVVEEGGTLATGSLHKDLSLLTSQLLDTQIIYLNLVNDFNSEKIRILLNGRAPFPEWKLITIILFSIIGGLLLIGLAFVAIRKLKSGSDVVEQRETLITQNTEG